MNEQLLLEIEDALLWVCDAIYDSGHPHRKPSERRIILTDSSVTYAFTEPNAFTPIIQEEIMEQLESMGFNVSLSLENNLTVSVR
jgi:hypothetical protein